MSTSMLEDKIIDLESRVAYQEDMILQLSDQLAEQQSDIQILNIQLKHLSDQVKLGYSSDSDNTSETPPHY